MKSRPAVDGGARGGRIARSGFIAITIPKSPSPTRLAGVQGGATQVQGTDQRLWRAMRQRQSGFDYRESAAQARLQLRSRRRSSRPCARSRCWFTSWQISRRIARQPTSAAARSRTRAGLHVSGIQRNIRDLRAYRPGDARQRSPRAALGALGPREYRLQGARSSASSRAASDDKIGALLDELKRLEGDGLHLRRRRRFVRAADAAHARPRAEIISISSASACSTTSGMRITRRSAKRW